MRKQYMGKYNKLVHSDFIFNEPWKCPFYLAAHDHDDLKMVNFNSPPP